MTRVKIGKVKRPAGSRLIFVRKNGDIVAIMASGVKKKIGKVKRPAKRMVFVDAAGNVMSMPFKKR